MIIEFHVPCAQKRGKKKKKIREKIEINNTILVSYLIFVLSRNYVELAEANLSPVNANANHNDIIIGVITVIKSVRQF